MQSDQPEKSPCTCPLHEKRTKSICHQTCGGSGLFVRPATHRFGSDPRCIVSGKPEARVLRGGGHLWPDKGGKGISQPTPWGQHRYSGRFVSQLKQKRRSILTNAFASGLYCVVNLERKSLTEVTHVTLAL